MERAKLIIDPLAPRPNASVRQPLVLRRGGSRRMVNVSEWQLYQLARLACTKTEAAQFFGFRDVSPMIRRMAADHRLAMAWDRGCAQVKISLRRLQFAHAQTPGSPGVQMTIHMSKHQLEETDKRSS